MPKKIIFLSHLDLNLYLFRLPIMIALINQGWDVIALSPKGNYSDRFAQYNIRFIPYKVDRSSLNPFKELKSIHAIYQILIKEKPDILHTFTAKPNIYGSIAAKIAKIPKIICTITGLGSFFIETTTKARLIRTIIQCLYKYIFKFSTAVIFQNTDDYQWFINKKIVPVQKAIVIKGSGLDTIKWKPDLNKSKTSDKIRILFIGRLLIHKGIREYLQMAKSLTAQFSNKIECGVAGDIDPGNPYSISKSMLDAAINAKTITFYGWQDNIQALLNETNIFVLPSYREGIPRTAIEAAAMGIPIVTTNTVGCKEVVDDQINGFLVPIKDATALTKAVQTLIENNALRTEMGQKSREKAKNEFNIQKIVSQYIKTYQI